MKVSPLEKFMFQQYHQRRSEYIQNIFESIRQEHLSKNLFNCSNNNSCVENNETSDVEQVVGWAEEFITTLKSEEEDEDFYIPCQKEESTI